MPSHNDDRDTEIRRPKAKLRATEQEIAFLQQRLGYAYQEIVDLRTRLPTRHHQVRIDDQAGAGTDGKAAPSEGA